MKHTVIIFAAAVLAASASAGDAVELPRSWSLMPVNGLVECTVPDEDSGACIVYHKCATPEEWQAGIPVEDFDELERVEPGHLFFTPTKAHTETVCAVHVEGEATITGLRTYRRRIDGEWVHLSRESLPVHRSRTTTNVVVDTTVAASMLPVMLSELGIIECRTHDDCSWTEVGFATIEEYVLAVVDCDHFKEDSDEYRDCVNPDWRTRFMKPRHILDTELARCWLDHANSAHRRSSSRYDQHDQLFDALEVLEWHLSDFGHHAWGDRGIPLFEDSVEYTSHTASGDWVTTHADCRELGPDDR